MPRRNLLIIAAVLAISLLCNVRARHGRYATVLADAMDEIRTRYIADVSPRELFEGAMNGMVDRLGDRYSNFLGEQEYRILREQDLDKEFEGIGVNLDPQAKQLTVLAPIYGGPAERAGVRAGDRILKVDGESIDGLSHEEAVHRIRGPRDTFVTLTILHEDAEQPVDIRIRRSLVNLESVVGFQRQSDGSWRYELDAAPRIAYVRLTSFSKRTADDLAAVLRQLDGAEPPYQGLVLDLRDNPGGLLDKAVEICDLFVREGAPIVTVRDRYDRIRDAFAAGSGPKFNRLPMAVLINGNSASASEIVAACLQDYGLATVVGTQSFGKGTVQHVVQLEGGRSALKLTTATYRRPSGKNIHRTELNEKDKEDWGVRPNAGFEVALTKEQAEAVRNAFRQRDRAGGKKQAEGKNGPATPAKTSLEVDPQLAKAVEYLRSQAPGGR